MPPKRKAGTGGKDKTRLKVDEGEARAEISNIASSSGAVPTPLALTPDDIQSILSRYPEHVSQLASAKPDSELQELDDWRLKKLPGLVRSRKPAHLEKPELERLMEWKLTRGKFRPMLRRLIAQNAPDNVHSSTKEAFESLSKLSSTASPYSDSFRTMLKSFCKMLKGVGPATASLVLSVYDDRVPFMSDEAYIWVMYADTGKKKEDIKYTENAYMDYAIKMWNVSKDLDISAVDLEKVGWVLGREWIVGAELRGPDSAKASAETQEAGADLPGNKRQKR